MFNNYADIINICDVSVTHRGFKLPNTKINFTNKYKYSIRLFSSKCSN